MLCISPWNSGNVHICTFKNWSIQTVAQNSLSRLDFESSCIFGISRGHQFDQSCWRHTVVHYFGFWIFYDWLLWNPYNLDRGTSILRIKVRVDALNPNHGVKIEVKVTIIIKKSWSLKKTLRDPLVISQNENDLLTKLTREKCLPPWKPNIGRPKRITSLMAIKERLGWERKIKILLQKIYLKADEMAQV